MAERKSGTSRAKKPEKKDFTKPRAKKCKLGETYTDEITGFTGVAVHRTEFLNGCIQVALEGRRQPGAIKEMPIMAFDEQRLIDGSQAVAGGPTQTLR